MLTAAHPQAWTGAAMAAATRMCPMPLPAAMALRTSLEAVAGVDSAMQRHH